MMEPVTLTQENFQTEVLDAKGTALVDFWAAWCGPCRMLSPVVDEVAAELSGVKVGKVNIDEQPDLAAQFDVMSIPTLVVFKDGKAVNQSVGVIPKEAILKMVK